MKPEILINKYFEDNLRLRDTILKHSKNVKDLAVKIASQLDLKNDMVFLKEAAMLHDIGVSQVKIKFNSESAKLSYINHGHLGRKILEKEGLSKHALVAERHVGAGISKKGAKVLGLPARDMLPDTIEEKLICFADKFDSKSPGKRDDIKSIEKEMSSYGDDSFRRFRKLRKLFGY